MPPSSLGRGHPSNAPFSALQPRLASPAQEETVALVRGGEQDEATHGAGTGRLAAAPLGSSSHLGEMGRQMQGRHQEWRLPLFWPWAL